jgi:transposase
MKFIQGHNQNQINLFPVSLDQSIDSDNDVRIIDLFVKSLLEEDIKKQKDRKDQYRELEKKLKESGDNQIYISDPDSRQIMLRNNITEVCYNVQTTVDAKHNIPIDYKVTNQNDSKAMGNMVQTVQNKSM